MRALQLWCIYPESQTSRGAIKSPANGKFINIYELRIYRDRDPRCHRAACNCIKVVVVRAAIMRAFLFLWVFMTYDITHRHNCPNAPKRNNEFQPFRRSHSVKHKIKHLVWTRFGLASSFKGFFFFCEFISFTNRAEKIGFEVRVVIELIWNRIIKRNGCCSSNIIAAMVCKTNHRYWKTRRCLRTTTSKSPTISLA